MGDHIWQDTDDMEIFKTFWADAKGFNWGLREGNEGWELYSRQNGLKTWVYQATMPWECVQEMIDDDNN